MGTDRRSACKLLGAATLAAAQRGVCAAAQPLRVLILGGTGFIGPHFVTALTAAGHRVTLFNRGRRKHDPMPQVELLIGDRNGQVDALKGRDWDVAIDDSGYTPRQVRLSAELLQGHIQQYVFISTISAYADLATPNIDESYRLAQLRDPSVEQINDDTYGGLKASCEEVVEGIYGANATVVRPTFIVGPGDTSDRFTYWPVRVARGGPMLAPGMPTDPIQFIDVRDLADFIRLTAEQRLTGRYNLCNPPRSVSIGMLLDVSKRMTHADTRFVWASAEFLEGEHLIDSGEIPIWVPLTSENAGAALISSKRAVASGLKFRSLEVTVRDTLAWNAQRPATQRETLRAGLSPEREAELLAKLHKGNPS